MGRRARTGFGTERANLRRVLELLVDLSPFLAVPFVVGLGFGALTGSWYALPVPIGVCIAALFALDGVDDQGPEAGTGAAIGLFLIELGTVTAFVGTFAGVWWRQARRHADPPPTASPAAARPARPRP